MRTLFQYIASSGGGGFTNAAVLLRAMAEEFPEDHVDVVCTPVSIPSEITGIVNLAVHPITNHLPHEVKRFVFEVHQVGVLARKFRSDVIWSMNVGPYVRTSVPQVLSLNNAFQIYPWGECAKYHPKSGAVLAGLRWFCRRSLRCSDAAIVQTPLMKQYLEKTLGAPRSIVVIPKSVEGMNDFKPHPLPAPAPTSPEGSPFRLLYVAAPWPHKNHATVIAATELLRRRERNVQLVLTLDPDRAVAIGGQTARRLLASKQLECVGWVEKHDLRRLYESCDACVMPSLLESLSSCYLEAMCWSRPQIVGDRTFARDTCGNAALYAAPTAPVDWARLMEELIDKPSLREALTVRGRAQIGTFPDSWRTMAQQVRSFLQTTVLQKTAL